MKKLIQVGAVLTLVVAFSVVSAFAKSVTRYDAQIPFEFSIGQKSYPAGTYVVRVTSDSTGTGLLSLEDTKGNQLEQILVSVSGDTNRGESLFVFNRYENKVFLTKIVTPQTGLVIPMSKDEKQIAKQNRQGKSRTQVAVARIN